MNQGSANPHDMCAPVQPQGRAGRSPAALADLAAGHFRRYHGYDYSRGASLFLTFNVEPKVDILGHVEAPGVLVHNEWGRQSEPDQSRRAGWLDLNANLAHLADRVVYARWEGGRLRW